MTPKGPKVNLCKYPNSIVVNIGKVGQYHGDFLFGMGWLFCLFGYVNHHLQVSVGDYIPWVMFAQDIYQPNYPIAENQANNWRPIPLLDVSNR